MDNARNTSIHGKRHAAAGSSLLRWALVPALVLAMTSPASATTTSGVDWSEFSNIEVGADADGYTGVVSSNHSWEARFVIHAGVFARVKSWAIYPVVELPNGQQLSFEPYKDSKSYDAFERPRNVERTEGSSFPKSFIEDFAIGACNANLQMMMNSGMSRATVLQQDHVVPMEVTPQLFYEVTTGDTLGEIPAFATRDIVCRKAPFQPVPPGSNDITADIEFILESASLHVFGDGNAVPKACPLELNLLMEVKGNLAQPFEAWVESTDGWQSTKTNLKANEFHQYTGLWGRKFNEELTIPLEMPTGGSGGGGIEPVTGSFAAEQLPGDPGGQTTGGGMSGAGGFATETLSPNVHQASLRLVARANGRTVKSDWSDYRVTCKPKAGIEVATNDFAPNPPGGGGKPGDGKPGDGEPGDGDPMPGSGGGEPAPNDGRKLTRMGKGKPSAQADKPGTGAAEAKPARSGRRWKQRKQSERKAEPAADKPASKPAAKPVRKPARKPAAKPSTKPATKPTAKQAEGSRAKPAAKPTKPSASKPKPTAKPSRGRAQANGGASDLRVIKARRSAKNPATIEFLVENAGQSAAAESKAELVCALPAGGSERWRTTVPALAAGSKKWVKSSSSDARRARMRVQGCRIEVDSNDEVAEANENNNMFSCRDCAAPVRVSKR